MSVNNIPSFTSKLSPPVKKKAGQFIKKNSSKIQAIFKKKVLPAFIVPFVDAKIRKYMCIAHTSQRLTTAERKAIKATPKGSDERMALVMQIREQRKVEYKKRSAKDQLFGQTASEAVKSSHKYARRCQKDHSLFQTAEEKLELARIVKNRAILKTNYRKQLGSLPNPTFGNFIAVKDVKTRIAALANNKSDKVVQTDDGATFSIVGGCKGHFVTYEFQQKDGEYYFIIHNRGLGSNKKELHGDLRFTHEMVPYGKTSVAIKTDAKTLADPKFLKSLLNSKNAPNMDQSQQIIINHFLSGPQPKGTLVKSIVEIACKLDNRQPTKEEIKLLLEDPSFHSFQIYGTCTESNINGAEKSFANGLTRKKVKYSTISQLTSELSSKILILPFNRKYRKEILVHKEHKLKQIKDGMLIHQLRSEIEQHKSKIKELKKGSDKKSIQQLKIEIKKLQTKLEDLGGAK